MKLISACLAICALAGCAADRPICVEEDPAFRRHMQSCLQAAPELRKLLVEGYDIRHCTAEANAGGLYTRNPRVCNDPKLHADIIRQRY